ncbi:MAG TPA: type II toxin-antitoxin system VapC family toxin [Tepidisphaeraceae bacterium]|jgi:tRNA(fMet)-specific endonuclease VapC|nr:type II toxin-antitoxin system VapC family toxin [Tepidisphaeraceae bacterium]
MPYLLDTNIVIFILKEPAGGLAMKLAQTSPSDVLICSVVEAELYYGATKYGVPARRKAALGGFLAPYSSLPFDSACVPHYANIRDQLERKGQIIGGNDLMIAAIAITHGLTLLTHNSNEFERVPGLSVEDWVRSGP